VQFKFSKKEELLQWAINDFAKKEIAAQELNALNYVLADLMEKIGKLGFFRIKIPERYGGKPGIWVMIEYSVFVGCKTWN